MDQHQELERLRHIREVNQSVRELESEASQVAKRYKRGIRSLENHAIAVESELDQDSLPAIGEIQSISPELQRLIADPTLNNIPLDNEV